MGIGNVGSYYAFVKESPNLQDYVNKTDFNSAISLKAPKQNIQLSFFYKYNGESTIFNIDEVASPYVLDNSLLW